MVQTKHSGRVSSCLPSKDPHVSYSKSEQTHFQPGVVLIPTIFCLSSLGSNCFTLLRCAYPVFGFSALMAKPIRGDHQRRVTLPPDCTPELTQNHQRPFRLPGVDGAQEHLKSPATALPKHLKKDVLKPKPFKTGSFTGCVGTPGKHVPPWCVR